MSIKYLCKVREIDNKLLKQKTGFDTLTHGQITAVNSGYISFLEKFSSLFLSSK